MNSSIPVGIVGVSGYSGMELARIVSRHPFLRLIAAVSDKWAGRALGDMLPLAGAAAALPCVAQSEAQSTFSGAQLVFFCTPPEVSIDLAGAALAAGARVVDLSGGFRLAAGVYPRWYGFAHRRPDLLADAVYSMPEVTDNAGALKTAALVANPGCYPTASTLAVLPLLRAGVMEREGLIIDAKSGTTGAGRKGTEDLSFSEIDGDFHAYRVLKHQHTPEIERALALSGAGDGPVTFTAHLLPTRRGILATAYGRLCAGKTAADADAAVRAFVRGKPFLRAAAADAVRLQAVVGTNRVLLGADADPERSVVVAFAAIDNLVKGAAGQAVQNANLMLGLDETAGLELLSGSMP
ncbi:MAG: N-acetyl-gamma-glutamyl-phosphate reductase [Deltaproteobacteria bacterium]|nr:N-acetyl-gamma-glutamyl-phosphate reductase [Deltaproteobacteria bacterium]